MLLSIYHGVLNAFFISKRKSCIPVFGYNYLSINGDYFTNVVIGSHNLGGIFKPNIHGGYNTLFPQG